MSEAFGAAMGKAMSNRSIQQDLALGKYNYMHFLRDPGQQPSEAVAKWQDFVNHNLDLARGLVETNQADRARDFFTAAVHAIMDSYSPVHNVNGEPQVFDPSWGKTEAVAHGHSPFDWEGHEGTKDLTPEVEAKMIKALREAHKYVYGNEPQIDSSSHSSGDHCATGVSCKSGTSLEWWN
jgi:hypothetical protein